MSKTVACIIARTVSNRLPLKVLRHVVDDLSLLDYLIQRVKKVNNIDEVYLCTSKEDSDDILEDVANKNKINIYRGSANAVIERMLDVADIANAQNLIRITGDNVFTSVEYIEDQIKFLNSNNLDYVRLIDVPIGATAEIMTTRALKECYKKMDPEVSEYLMLYMFEPNDFNCGVIKPFEQSYSSTSVTVDTKEDLSRTREIFRLIENTEPLNITLESIIHTALDHNLPHFEIKPGGTVKLPYGKTITYAEFSEDMARRINKSKRLNLFK